MIYAILVISFTIMICTIVYLSYIERKHLIHIIISKTPQDISILEQDPKIKIKVSKPLSDEDEAIIEELRR